MNSMLQKLVNRQEVPDRGTGIVVGIDVSKGKFDFAAFRPEGRTNTFQVSQDALGFGRLKEFINDFQNSGHQVWVGFEPTGPYSICLREFLLSNHCRTVQVNPFHSKRFKEVRDNSPLKTDGKDPGVIADLILQGCYQEVHPTSEINAELRAAVLDWKSCDKTRTALRNELQSILELWFPELLRFLSDPLAKAIVVLIRNYRSVKEISQASQLEIRSLMRKASRGNIRLEKADAIRQAAGQSVAWGQGQEMRYRHICRLLDQLEAVEFYRADLRKQMRNLLAQSTQAECLLSVPGVGIITTASLLGMCGDLRGYANCHQLEKFVGLNLFEISSGQLKGKRHISKRGNEVARCAMFLAAICQMKKGGLYYEYTLRQREKRQSGRKIQIAIARKLLKLLYTLAQKGLKFEERKFLRKLEAGDDQGDL